MNTIVIFKEKHWDRCFDISTKEQKEKVFEKILKERIDAGYFYKGYHLEAAKQALENHKAVSFLCDRMVYEYEEFVYMSVENLEEE